MVHAGQGGVGLDGLGWSGLVRVVKIFGWVGVGWGGWLGRGGLECGKVGQGASGHGEYYGKKE